MYLTDYHTHTKLSPDGSVPLAEMAEAAVAAGLNELCITDHCDLLELYGEPVDHYDWPPALEQYAAVAPRYAGKLTIRLGLEFGMAHLNPEASRAILDRPELDFVLGSIHNLCPQKGGTDFYYVDYPDPAACYAALDDYFASMAQLAVTDFYDVLSHIIYPLRYMDHPISLDHYHDVLDGIFRAAAERGRGIEINTCARMSLLIRRSPSEKQLTEKAQAMMKKIENCLHCGACAKKCPYGLDTPRLLEENYKDYQEILAGKPL